MKILSSIPSFLRNKYLLATAAFVVWMLFFDNNDFFMQVKRKGELRQIEKTKEYLKTQIAEDRQFSEELKNNPEAIEKFAREQYKMKRDNEDLFNTANPVTRKQIAAQYLFVKAVYKSVRSLKDRNIFGS